MIEEDEESEKKPSPIRPFGHLSRRRRGAASALNKTIETGSPEKTLFMKGAMKKTDTSFDTAKNPFGGRKKVHFNGLSETTESQRSLRSRSRAAKKQETSAMEDPKSKPPVEAKSGATSRSNSRSRRRGASRPVR